MPECSPRLRSLLQHPFAVVLLYLATFAAALILIQKVPLETCSVQGQDSTLKRKPQTLHTGGRHRKRLEHPASAS